MKKNKNVLKKCLVLFGFMFLTLATCYKVEAVNVAFSFNRLLFPGETPMVGHYFRLYPEDPVKVTDQTSVAAAAQSNVTAYNAGEGRGNPFVFIANTYYYFINVEGEFQKIDPNSPIADLSNPEVNLFNGRERIIIYLIQVPLWTRMQGEPVLMDTILNDARVSEGIFVDDLSESIFFGLHEEEEEKEEEEKDDVASEPDSKAPDSENRSLSTRVAVPPVQYPAVPRSVIIMSSTMERRGICVRNIPEGAPSGNYTALLFLETGVSLRLFYRKGSSFGSIEPNEPIPHDPESDMYPEKFSLYAVPQTVEGALEKLRDAEQKLFEPLIERAKTSVNRSVVTPGSLPKEEISEACKTLISYGVDYVEVDECEEEEHQKSRRPKKPKKPRQVLPPLPQ